MHNSPMTTAHHIGNNEVISTGYRFMGEQGYLALTSTESKWFKTETGAVKWLARRGYTPTGARI